MVLVRRIHKRGANIVVEANGEVLFAPTGPIGDWTRRFSQRVRAFSAAEAPDNKRPRWGHYGKPLKATMTASTTYQPLRMRVYSAVGSTSPHAYYVDQGTGVYAGSGPYEAKILPPWTRGSPSLYENTWRPGGPGGRRVKPVLIKGQRGQFFFDAGLKRGFQSMRMRSFQVPGDGQISAAMGSFPTGLANFLGNTVANAAFIGSLTEWRAWRDAAWKTREGLGRGFGIGSKAHAAHVAKAHAASHVRGSRPKPPKPPKPDQTTTHAQVMAQLLSAIKKERVALVQQARAKYVGRTVKVGGRRKHDGVYAYEVTVTANGRSISFWITSDYQAGLAF